MAKGAHESITIAAAVAPSGAAMSTSLFKPSNAMHPEISFMEIVLVIGFGLSTTVLWLFALISALTNERIDPTMKLVWTIVIIFVPIIGSIIYLAIAPSRLARDQKALAELHARQRSFSQQARATSE